MRRRSLLATTAVLTLASLAVAAPAHADTITEVDVTDATVVHVTSANFVYGTYTPWEPEGPAVFPSVVDWGVVSSSYVLQGYAPVLPTLAADCTRTVDSFSVTIQGDDGSTEDGFYVGVPANGDAESTATFDGDGVLTIDGDGTDGEYYTVAADAEGLSGTLTVTIPPTDDSESFLGWVGFYSNASGYTVEGVSFGTTVTCPDPVVAAAPQLAETGVDQGAAIVGGVIGGLAL
ncbi:hypothetical protein FJ656_10970, partial [Schumannella luteola]